VNNPAGSLLSLILRTSDFDYFLPPELIAQAPLPQRDQSRLLVLQRDAKKIAHQHFPNLLKHFRAGDVLVLNNSKVIPARLRGVNASTGGQFEILLLEENSPNNWWVMLRPGKRARVGSEIILQNLRGEKTGLHAKVTAVNGEGHRRLEFSGGDLRNSLDALGEIPLPPYITRNNSAELSEDNVRYQTVYAATAGSVAAPTAGLHFTESLLKEIRARGVQVCFVTLHVGLGTFAPVKAETVHEHTMHEERYEVSDETAHIINHARLKEQRIFAAGTTTLRVLESVAAQNDGVITAGSGRTRIFIYPPYKFKIVNALLTNFHLPRSTLVMLASAFASPEKTDGRELILKAYEEAVREKYRFFSYGDAMLII
jgi:S-adenosylmethionine:tRNA ribosyltransferase-isomerase